MVHASYKEVIYEPFISIKEQSAHFQRKKGEIFNPLVSISLYPLLHHPVHVSD